MYLDTHMGTLCINGFCTLCNLTDPLFVKLSNKPITVLKFAQSINEETITHYSITTELNHLIFTATYTYFIYKHYSLSTTNMTPHKFLIEHFLLYAL